VVFKVRGMEESCGKNSDTSRFTGDQFSFTAFSLADRQGMEALTETARPLKRKVT